MTEQPRPLSGHPSPDELADLRADELPAARQGEISAHVATCAQCTSELAAMDEVEILLGEAGRVSVAMPDDVAASLDATLARLSLERSTGVASLDEKRATKAPSSRISTWLPRLGAAAAVLVIAGFVVNLTGNRGGDDNSASDAGDSGGSSVLSPEEGAGGSDNSAGGGSDYLRRLAPQRLNKSNLPTYAGALARAPAPTASALDQPNSPTAEAARLCPTTKVTGKVRRTAVRFEGTLAFVVVKPEAREVSVYTCDSPPKWLYSTSY